MITYLLTLSPLGVKNELIYSNHLLIYRAYQDIKKIFEYVSSKKKEIENKCESDAGISQSSVFFSIHPHKVMQTY